MKPGKLEVDSKVASTSGSSVIQAKPEIISTVNLWLKGGRKAIFEHNATARYQGFV